MIVEPEQRVADFIKAGSDIVSVHAEQSATIHLHRLVNNVRSTLHAPLAAPDLVLTNPYHYCCFSVIDSPDLPSSRDYCLLALCADQGPWSKGWSCPKPWNIPHSH
jgi:hypothetical protein